MARRPLVVIVGLGAAFVIAATTLLALTGWFSRPGDPGLDPTEQFFELRLANDLGRSVVVNQCDATCSRFHDVFHLKPGESAYENVSSDLSVRTRFLVADAAGKTLGCLSLTFDHKVTGAKVSVSQMGPCDR